ncbi:hypothetical protein [Kineococcus arenarius]|uniref:hypothetical protein n=1 Tax=Kineococcus sp. SYSU DK007 TaxID=3383128 RepID=UPI003D7CCEBF
MSISFARTGPRLLAFLPSREATSPVEAAQYVAVRYTERLAAEGAVASVGSTGDSYDNALAEAFSLCQ